MAIRYHGLIYPGLIYPGLIYPGLYKTHYIGPFQTINNIIKMLSNHTNHIFPNHIYPYSPYHRYYGLSMYSIYRPKPGISHIETLDSPYNEITQKWAVYKETLNIPIGIYTHIHGYKGLMV